MTPDRPLHRDTREDIEALAHRARIILPDVILADGTASSDQVAIVPPGVDLAKAFLPHREQPGPPTTGPGAALVGTREPDIGPWLSAHGTVIVHQRHPHITRPQSRDDILKWLYDISGLRFAPAAFWRVAGWEIGWLANWLDRLLTGGTMCELIVAERQAAAAVRAAWVVLQGGRGSPLSDTGILLAARAVIDMLTAFNRHVAEALHNSRTSAAIQKIAEAQAAILQRLRSCVCAIEVAAAGKGLRREKIGRALEHARDIVASIGLFTAVGEPIGARVLRITEELPTKGRRPPLVATTFTAELGQLSDRLEAIIARAPDVTASVLWCADTVGDLSRLYNSGRQRRQEGLGIVRTDLLYKLVVTRRLNRVFKALPWMLAPSGAFRLTYGGPIGAVATVLEVARHREIALEQKSRTFDSAAGPRLDTRRGKREYSDPTKVRRALRLGTRAGFWLATSALSHHMVQAFLAGRAFDPAHPLPTLQEGGLGWRFERAMHDPATLDTVTATELAKPIYASTSYHRNLATYMGLGTADLLTLLMLDAFPSEFRNPSYNAFTTRANARRKELGLGTDPFSHSRAGAANRELLRSILKSLDTPTDGIDADWRQPLSDEPEPGDIELRRFDERHTAHNGGRESDGGKVRVRAAAIRKAQKDPSKQLRQLVDRARSWKVGGYSDERPLVAILAGRRRLSGPTPVAQVGMPVIWFRPDIDVEIHGWIADQAPMWQPIAIGNVVHAGLVAQEVQAMAKAMPQLFGMPLPPVLRNRILVPLWTGFAGITDDHAHVR